MDDWGARVVVYIWGLHLFIGFALLPRSDPRVGRSLVSLGRCCWALLSMALLGLGLGCGGK